MLAFANRTAAGRVLASRLRGDAWERPVVLALPRGGVPVAAEVAAELDAPLGIVAVRKIGAPGHPEYAVGALAEGGICVVDDEAVHATRMTPAQLDRTIAAEGRELERRVALYRRAAAAPEVERRDVVLVDDGLATGLSAVAAARAVQVHRPRRLVIASPVASHEAVALLEPEADLIDVVEVPDRFEAVGHWYVDFGQTSDAEVVALLSGASGRPGPG